MGRKYDVIEEWSNWADSVQGYGINSGHYLPEETPEETLNALLKFLTK